VDALEAIKSRRSIRHFEHTEIGEEVIHTILEAAMHAPSAGNEQPWHFIVVKDKKMLMQVPPINPYAEMALEAPCAILVCADVTLEKHKGNWMLDTSAAAQNILLAAHALGLGAVWTGIYPREDLMQAFSKLFHLPTNVKPLAFIPIGYPAEKIRRDRRFREDRIHRNRW
jgi:nitroreductase